MQEVGFNMNLEPEELYKQRKKRIDATTNLKVPDRVPVIFSENEFAWDFANISQLEFMTDNEKMMMAYEKLFKTFQQDAAYFAPSLFDPLFNVIPSPCIIKLPGKDLPEDSPFQLVETEIMTEDDYNFASKKGYFRTLVKLLPKLRPEIPDVQNIFTEKIARSVEDMKGTSSNPKKFIEWGFPFWGGGGMESPFSLLCLMRSYEKFCLDMYRRRDIVKQTVDKFIPEIVRMSLSGVKASGVPRAQIGLHRESSSTFSLKIFEEIAFPMIKKLVAALSKENVITILHCDGDWTPNLEYLTELPKGTCILDLDNSTDIFKAKEILGDRMCIAGNLHEPLFAFSTPQKVEEYCKKLIDIVGEGGGFVLKGEPPRESKLENIMAMGNTAKNYGVY